MTAAVLIADGDEVVCYGLARAVRRFGLLPLVAADEARAVDLVRSHAGPLVAAVLDVRTAGADAETLLARLAEARPGCPVVLTGTDHAALAAARHHPGVRAALDKPFELAAFTTCLASFADEAAVRAG